MRAKYILVLEATESRAKISPDKYINVPRLPLMSVLMLCSL